MCGIVGTREAFFSKTKRFCSVSCSRSYSSNSKKASILARLQVRGGHLEDPSRGPGLPDGNKWLTNGKGPTRLGKDLAVSICGCQIPGICYDLKLQRAEDAICGAH